MQPYNGVWIGHREAQCVSSIQWIAEHQPSLFLRFPYALIAQVDSTRPALVTFPSVSRLVETAGISPRQMQGGILLSSEDLVRVAVERFFTGFDEVWFFCQRPEVDLPDHVRVPCRAGEAVAAAWMSESGAVLGLTDGTGLYYITSDREIAEALDAFSFDGE